MAVIIGIDPGSLRTGWGVISLEASRETCLEFGVIELADSWSFEKRMARLLSDLRLILEKWRPEVMAVEKVFLGKNADSAFKLGHARGVALALAGAHEMELAEYATRHVKKMLTGTGAATKEQVQFLVQNILNIRAVQLDATDALAVAICHGREAEVAKMLAHQQLINSRASSAGK